MKSTRLSTCPLCEATCGIAVEVETSGEPASRTREDKIVSIRGDEKDPFSQGYLCPKALALRDLHDDPDRLRGPLKRTPRGLEPCGWEEALELAAGGLARVQRAHGRDAVAGYLGNPTAHGLGGLLFGIPFLESLRTKNRYSATSVDQLPRMLVSLLVYGHQVLLPVPDVERTDFLLVMGANPAVSNGSVMTAPGASKRLAAIEKRGGKVVVVDPRRTETAALADRHVFVRPGTDALLLLSLANVIFEEGLARPGRLADFTDGLDQVRAAARRFPPELTAAATGVPAVEARRLARELAEAPRGVVYGRIGLCTQEFGTLATWLVDVLNVITGNLDREGGCLFTKPAVDLVPLLAKAGQSGSFGAWRTEGGLPEFGRETPAAALADEMESGRVKALVTLAGNPVLSNPNGRRLDRAIAGLEFRVAVDIYVNETTRHADVILPPTVALERDHYDIALYTVSVRNMAKLVPPALPKPAGQLHEWEILLELGTRLLARGNVLERVAAPVARAVLKRLGPRGLLDLGLRAGPYGLSVAKLLRHPHGLDLGPLEPSLPGRLYTRGKRIQLAPPALIQDLDRLEAARLREASRPPAELRLIGRRQLRTNNSWLHNCAHLVEGRKDPCTLLVHPDDARARGLTTGGKARLTSRAGSIVVPVDVTDDMMPGVVSLPHGWGHDREGSRLKVAAAHAGVSVNDVTDERFVDVFSGTSALNGVPVTLEPVVATTPKPATAGAAKG